MGQFLDQIVMASKRGRGFSEKVLVGIRPEQFARKPRFETVGGPRVVDCNHPCFVFGHLSLYPSRIAMFLNVDAAGLDAPTGFEALFKAGVDCQDDVEGKIYPAMETVTRAFFQSYDRLYERMARVDDAVLLREVPEERYRQFFPTVGAAAGFMLTSHIMMHMGQVSTWRRCFGLPSAM